MERLPVTVAKLAEAAASVAGQADLAAVLRTTVRTAITLTGAAYGALGVTGEHGTLTDFIYEGVDRATADKIGSLPIGRGLLGAIENQPVRVDDLTDHPSSVGFPAHHPPMVSFLGVAVGIGRFRYGNLYLADSARGTFSDDDEAVIVALAGIAASAIARARLEERLENAALIEDRERIARDIHDGVIQELFAVGLALGAARDAEPDLARREIEEAMASIDEAMTRLRNYIFDLQTPEPDFEARLRTMVSKAAGDTHVDIKVDGDFAQIEPSVADHLSHFVREGVSNAIRHAGAGAVTVSATCDDEIAVVEVTDDGRGFDPEDRHDGMGLANMRERMSVLGGTCEISSGANGGTVARGSVPI